MSDTSDTNPSAQHGGQDHPTGTQPETPETSSPVNPAAGRGIDQSPNNPEGGIQNASNHPAAGSQTAEPQPGIDRPPGGAPVSEESESLANKGDEDSESEE